MKYAEIGEELEFTSQIRISRKLTDEEHRREAKLMADFNLVERHIIKELGDIEPTIP